MINRLKSGLIVGVVLLMEALPLAAQTYQTMHNGMNNWYFGNTPKYLEFNRITKIPTVETGKTTPFGTGGGATASNPGNGNLMFYTDGANVYDAYNQIMPNGSGLLGNPSSNQPVAICPVPGQPNKYFIFTNSANNGASGSISYEVVDMTQLGNSLFPSIVPQGDLEAPLHTAIGGLTGRAEAMTIIPHSNGTDYWLFTQQANSISYTATLINAASYNITHTGVFTSTTTTGPGLTMTASHFAAFGNNIAVAPTTANMDAIILTFIEASSSFVLNRTIVNSASAGTNGQAIYDIEWSGDGRYIYYSIFGDAGVPGNVFQYDFTAPLTTLVSALPATVFRSYGLQLAPDSTMYHIYQATGGGPFLIGRFNDPDSVAALVNYETLPLDNTDWAATQFPALLPVITPVINVSFITAGNCQNSPTSFYPTVTPAADSLVWDFGDGNPPVNAWSPVHTYQNAGPVNATVTAFYQGQSQVSAPVAINITAFPLQLTLVADTTACTFEFPPPVGTSGPPPFSVTATVQGGSGSSIWSNGDTGLTLTPDSAGYYYVVVTSGGCSAYAGVNVKEYGVTDQRSNVWYFGNLAGIDFNQTPPVALDDSAMDAPEGCSAMSDRNGEIIFYTDGNNVYDQDHTQIATGIGGNTAATQSVLIVPVPGDETLYYIFTTEANSDYPSNTVYYSLFDLKQNSGKGAVVQARVPLYSGSTERLASNGNWLITHEYGNNSFRCYPISALGIGEAVITAIGSDHAYTDPTLAEGYMKISPSSVVAVPISIPGTSNFIEVFDFVDSTGVLTNFRSVDLQETTAQVYGIEFSGDKMFATLTGPPSFIREVYFDFENNPVLIPPVAANSGPFPEELGAIQIAPDGQIYIAINGSTSLGTFTINPDTLQLSTVNMAGFALAGGTSSNLGLPSFVQSQGNAFGGPAMTIAGVCFGTPMDYIATPTDPIDVFLWGFGDGATSNAESGQHSYGATGTYTVTLNMTNRCGLDTLMSQNITIVNPPAPPTLAPTNAICTTPVTLNANGGVSTGLTFLWNTGAITEAITVNSIGTYSVTITDTFGCTSDGQTNMLDARPPVNLGPDQTVCEGSVVATLNAQNPPPSFSHLWTLDGVAIGNTTPTQVVTTTTPGTDLYEVTVTNIATGCQTVEAVRFIITESPNFTVTPFPTTACLTPTGRIDLNITPLLATVEPPIHRFSYFVSGPVSSSVFSVDDGPQPSIINLFGGTYSVVVQDDISGCAVSQVAIVSDPANTLTVPDNTNTCAPVGLTGTTNANTVPSAGTYSYRVFDSGGTQVANGTSNLATFTSAALPPGTYSVEVERGGCIASDIGNVITQLALSNFATTTDVCATSPTIVGAGPSTYTFAGTDAASTGIIQSFNTTTLTLNKVAGTYSYNVTATDGLLCPNTQLVPITLESTVAAALTQSDPCQTAVTLNASPASSGFSYQWYRSGTLDGTLLGQTVSLTAADNGTQFRVDLISTTSGCTYQSPPLTASVVGPVTAAISSTPACDDGSPFTITAMTSAGSPTYTWSRDIGGGFVIITGEVAASTSQTTEGIYKIRVSQGTCSAEASIQLLKAPLPIGSLPDRVIICDDPENADPATDHYDLDPGVFTAYDWWIKQTADAPEVNLGFTDQVYTAERKAFHYRVELTNTFGCKASDYTEVLNDCVPKLYAPNAFRPSSGVALNKVFAVQSFFITDEFKVFIFNRWGELVYQSDDRYFQWNGGREGDATIPLPSGAYAYVIQYVSTFRPDEGVQEKRGGVMLLR